MSSVVLSPRIAKGFYPEKRASKETKFDAMVISALGNATRWVKARPRRFADIVVAVNGHEAAFQGRDDEGLAAEVDLLREELRTQGLHAESVARCFALIREVSRRRLGMRHHDVQVIGGWVLLNGMVAEMETGEGKTLTATLAACAASLAGIPVHVITVNDYLAARDAEAMRPLYEAFGLRVGTVVQGMSPDDRRRAYQCDVTYCTNKEVVFDYLKDRLVLGQQPGYIQMQLERLSGSHARIDRLLLRGLPFAIVDEADSVLIDEARTPLIISGPADNSYETQVYEQALAVAKALRPGEDFTIEEGKRTLDLTEEGKHRVRDLAQPLGPVWTGTYRREEMIRQALTAMHLFCRDREYIVRDDKIQIVDEYTGRTMADRSWERGLHQLIEAKEGCKITAQNETLARISYQRFFRRYRHLAGMTGTAREVANELWSVYRLNVVPIPTNRPLARIGLPERICLTAEEKWSEIVAAISELNGQGRPVLVGTRSVAASEQLSALLTGSGLPHRVLNARQDKEEAEIIAGAGQGGRITVATNMAGRGTDISLGADVRERGGLHVIATELHDAKRIDRQLFGRCGRQGDPGSYQAIVSLEDDLLKSYGEKALGRIISGWVQNGSAYGQRTAKLFASYVQHTAQRKHFHMRRDLLKFDESMESAIAFSGRGE